MATPIGNLEDITLRAIRVLKDVHLIAAEDTRRTKKLLDAYEIHTPMTSLYDQIEERKSGLLVAKMNEGMNVAYVSDAGTPGISDPGFLLINQAIDHGIRIISIPGVSAVIAALSVSGLPMDTFTFYGFLPSRSGKRKQWLSSLMDDTKTLIFYESPKRLMNSLVDIEAVLGNRKVVVLRELTKMYEEILRGKVSDVIEQLQGRVIKGEVTIVLAGREKIIHSLSDNEICDRYREIRDNSDYSRRDIIKKLAEELGISRKRVYRLIVNYDG
ncbi:MAG: 16S rRNA (cytidine(1402)-2'-O)-methyltransferase [Syntrophaceae bacterium]